MKRVGIILRDYTSLSHSALFGLRQDLIEYLRNYKVEVICIPILFNDNEYEELDRGIELIKQCDGIILPGGDKVYDIDLKIVNYLYEKDIPTFGICLGMQIMALAFNGDIEHLPNQNHQKKEGYVHQIKIKETSKLAHILKSTSISVNSRHIEHITTTDLTINAIAKDLTIEGVEKDNKKFFIGVQWHPESLKNDLYSKKLFDAFIHSL